MLALVTLTADSERKGIDVNLDELEYLATRLEAIASEECSLGAALVRRAAQSPSSGAIFDHALCHRIWNHMTRALDLGVPQASRLQADALEAEMAGRTLSARLALGWLQRSPTGPDEFPSIEQFI